MFVKPPDGYYFARTVSNENNSHAYAPVTPTSTGRAGILRYTAPTRCIWVGTGRATAV